MSQIRNATAYLDLVGGSLLRDHKCKYTKYTARMRNDCRRLRVCWLWDNRMDIDSGKLGGSNVPESWERAKKKKTILIQE